MPFLSLSLLILSLFIALYFSTVLLKGTVVLNESLLLEFYISIEEAKEIGCGPLTCQHDPWPTLGNQHVRACLFLSEFPCSFLSTSHCGCQGNKQVPGRSIKRHIRN